MKIKQKIMLDIGCGFNKQPGFIGMDKRAVDGVDIVHDAEVFPWPIESESCAVVVMSHLVEHIKPWLQVELVDECWRVLEIGGLLMIATPHGRSHGYLQDPTHCSPWVENTVEYFIPGTNLYEVYRPKPWSLKKQIYSIRGNIEIGMKKITDGNR